jgi:ubiquinone/menaquinone biosynthesis C-methylase UbiE
MSKYFFKNFLDTHPAVEFNLGLYYQKGLEKNLLFEKHYTELRKNEGRLYDDQVVKKLPLIAQTHPLAREWAIRKRSTDRLISFLRSKKPKTILEIGCGNGWLINYLHDKLHVDCCGVDVNETELKQAATVFGKHDTLSFLYADIHSGLLKDMRVDVIVLASVIQYFTDATALLSKLQKMLTPEGQIHILDSPFYDDDDVSMAKQRSEKYFTEAGQQAMRFHYYHHSWKALDAFKISFAHNPASGINRLLRKFKEDTPFPWIIIEKHNTLS